MADPPPPPAIAVQGERTLAELDADSVAHCADFLELRDVINLSMGCKSLRAAAHSDYIWTRLFKERWPSQHLSSVDFNIRERYISRYIALQQMRFSDPCVSFLSVDLGHLAAPHSHLILDKNHIWAAQGSEVDHIVLDSSGDLICGGEMLKSHGSRITSMRLFPISDTWLSRHDMQNTENVLVTSSADRTIRLWLKGRSQRCYKGHSGPVTALADRLLGFDGSKLLASGSEDCTVRIWSVGSGHKNHALTTCLGHQKPLSFLSVAWHKPSLLISISKDSKLRAWDTGATPTNNSAPCVGSVSLAAFPVGMKCHDAICYIASQSMITALDLRTMQRAFNITFNNNRARIFSFEMLPSKWLLCSGGDDKSMLWDIRKIRDSSPPNPIAELDANGRVTLIHMDPYKVVTAGPFDHRVNIWETGSGVFVNSLDCSVPGESTEITGISVMSVDGCRIVTNACGTENGVLCRRDFSDCSVPVNLNEFEAGSKFWDTEI